VSDREATWHQLIAGESPHWWSAPARAGLQLLSWPYAAGIASYRALFDLGFIRPAELPCPVVSIGNITLGGTGKTTTVRWLARKLRSWGLHPAILSRGYGVGMSADDVRVVASDREVLLGPGDGGDEPLLLARSLPGVPLVIGRRRVLTGRAVWERFKPDVVLMDDAFQYWRLKKDVEIVLLDASSPYGCGAVFPRGTLREPLRGLRRAHAAILTHAAWADENARAKTRADVARRMPGAVLAEARHVPTGVRDHATGEAMGVERLQGRWLAVSGLGNPEAFLHTLKEIGAGQYEAAPFPDHHRYTQQDLANLGERVRSGRFAGIVTTEKDAVKIRPEWTAGIDCYVLEIDLELLSGERDLEALLRERLKRR
jgi:tetraacyldisaccharide 4'-kinase